MSAETPHFCKTGFFPSLQTHGSTCWNSTSKASTQSAASRTCPRLQTIWRWVRPDLPSTPETRGRPRTCENSGRSRSQPCKSLSRIPPSAFTSSAGPAALARVATKMVSQSLSMSERQRAKFTSRLRQSAEICAGCRRVTDGSRVCLMSFHLRMSCLTSHMSYDHRCLALFVP